MSCNYNSFKKQERQNKFINNVIHTDNQECCNKTTCDGLIDDLNNLVFECDDLYGHNNFQSVKGAVSSANTKCGQLRTRLKEVRAIQFGKGLNNLKHQTKPKPKTKTKAKAKAKTKAKAKAKAKSKSKAKAKAKTKKRLKKVKLV
jgi:hypothetical protein